LACPRNQNLSGILRLAEASSPSQRQAREGQPTRGYQPLGSQVNADSGSMIIPAPSNHLNLPAARRFSGGIAGTALA
jgi:hypothetical protein